MAIVINDHEGLHASVARSVLAGGAAALVGLFLPAGSGAAAMALALGLAVAVPRSWPSAAWAVLWACAAGAAAGLGGPVGMAGAALAVGASLARGVDGRAKRLLAAGVGALGAAAAGLIARAVDVSGVLAALPQGLEALAAGAAGGLTVGVASIGRHVEREAPAIGSALDAELAGLPAEGELGELLERALAAHREAVAALGAGAPEARVAADELMAKMARFGRKWREIEADAARSLPEDVHARLALVERRIEATTDTFARAEFERAREALRAQLAYLDEIARGRERAVARLTHQVAMLERLRLAAVRHRSADAARLGAELQPMVDELSEAGGDLDLATEALSEATQLSVPQLPRSQAN